MMAPCTVFPEAMEPYEINWVGKVADWVWGLVAVMLPGMVYWLMRLNREHITNTARIKALEDHHLERLRMMEKLERLIEEGRRERVQQMDGLNDRLDALRRDVRHDVRDIIQAAWLNKERDRQERDR